MLIGLTILYLTWRTTKDSTLEVWGIVSGYEVGKCDVAVHVGVRGQESAGQLTV